MKFVLAACFCAAVVFAQEETAPETAVRELPADVLRDFPFACFASTACKVFQINQTWHLSPFCGRSTCLEGPNGLIERVEDCGPRPKPNPACRIVNHDTLERAFPECCPRYVCEPGVQLEYPTEAELKAAFEASQNSLAQAASTSPEPETTPTA